MPENKDKKKETQAEILVGQASKLPLFHTAEDEVYVRVPVANHYEVWPVRSKGFRRWLSGLFFEQVGKPPSSQAMADALTTIEGLGQFQFPQEEVHIRMANHEDRIYLDLANPGWEAVEISRYGWNVIQNPPVNFRRPSGSSPLPYPDPAGDLQLLEGLLNLPDPGQPTFILILAWLIQAARPYGPYPVLVLHGEQGAAKSTITRILKALIDPCTVPLRTMPRSERDLMISARNNWILAFDNMSGIRDWQSDAFCRLSTGGGLSTRELYTNDEEVLFNAQRPLILNGMDEMVTRHDLADRCIFLKFPPIPDEKRITEKDLVECFNKVQPLILGALLDAVVTAMDNISSITLEELPRMADFATWIAAAEPALPGERGAFADAYNENRKEIVELSLEVDLLATEVRKLMEDRDRWEGTATELLDALEAGMEDRERNRKGWPKAPNVLSRRLVRLSSFLRRVGIQVDRKDPKGKDRGITIHRLNQKNTVHTVSTVQDQEKCESTADDKMDDTDDSTVQRTRTNLSTVRKNANNINGVDDTDDMDDKNPLLSKPHRDKCNKCKLCEVGQGTFLCNFEDPTPIGDLNFCPLDAS